MFEIVHAVTDYYDGPRRGVADYEGRPHVFVRESRPAEADFIDTFLLTPIDEDVFALAQESWAIWCRWLAAFQRGRADPSTHPALPADRERHAELERLLGGRLDGDPCVATRRVAEFRKRSGPLEAGCKPPLLEVCWSDPPGCGPVTRTSANPPSPNDAP